MEFDTVKLPKELWSFMTKSITLKLLFDKSESKYSADNQIWTLIPNEQRDWIDISELEESVFSKKKDFIGLDFNMNRPQISSGKYWMNEIKNSIENDLTLESRNIFVFNTKMDFFLFYIESNGIMAYGEKKEALLKQVQGK